MLGHGGIVAFDERPTCASWPAPAHFGAARELRQVLPLPHRPAARARDGRRGRAPWTARSSRRCSRRSSSARSAPTAAACPRRSAACSRTSARSSGLERMSSDRGRDRRQGGGGRARHDGARGGHARRAARADALLRRAQAPFGACRVCMVGVEGRRAVAACTTPCRDGMEVNTDDATARRVAAATVELVMSELPSRPAEHTELAEVAALFEIGERAGRARSARAATTSATPTSRSSTSSASPAGAAYAPATRSREPSRSQRPAAASRPTSRPASTPGFRESTCVSCGACADTCRRTPSPSIFCSSSLRRQ